MNDREDESRRESSSPSGVQDLRRAVRELSALNDIASAINASMSVNEICDDIIERCTRHVRASQGAIFLLSKDESPGVTFVRAVDTASSELPIHLNNLLSGWMAINRRVLVCNETGAVPELDDADFAAEGIRSLLAVPLLARDNILGLLVVFNKRDEEGFQANDSRFLYMAATQVSKVIENAQLYEREANMIARMQQQRMAVMANLVAGIAHDMNNPTGAVLASAGALSKLEGALKDGLQKRGAGDLLAQPEIQRPLTVLSDCVRAIQSGATRVAETVARLRSFAKLDQAEYQTTDVNHCLEETVALLRSQLGERIKVALDLGSIPMIHACSAKLNQLFYSLLMNSIEAIAERGTITVQTALEEQFICVVLRDDGKGIPEECIDQVSDPGFTTKGVRVGVGLGLPMSRQIVRTHGGDLVVRSKEGEGTTVTIRLPVAGQARTDD